MPLLFLYLCIPAIYVHLLYRTKHRLNPPMHDKDQAYAKRAQDQKIKHLRFLFGDYRVDQYLFECAEMGRRVTMISVLPLIPDQVIRSAVGCILAATWCVVFREILPFQG